MSMVKCLQSTLFDITGHFFCNGIRQFYNQKALQNRAFAKPSTRWKSGVRSPERNMNAMVSVGYD